MVDTYVICATPRSGSTLFCQYLTSTKVAGTPESYFRQEDLPEYAQYWGISDADGNYDFTEYLEATRKAGSTENGVLALRVMWTTLHELTDKLSRLYPEQQKTDRGLLESVFGQLKFIYLWREDVIAQAISLYRAQETGYWHADEGEPPEQPPSFDFGAIDALVSELRHDNLAWQAWFDEAGITPLSVKYEDFVGDPRSVTVDALQFLGIALPADAELTASNRRLSDETTLAWLKRYDEELKSRA